MLYATDGIKSDEDFNKAMVGVGSVWCVQLIFCFPNLTTWRPTGTRATRVYPFLS